MTTSPSQPLPLPTDTARALVGAAIARHGTTATARAMGVLPRTMLQWFAGASRPSTDDSMRGRVALLASLDP